jgi:hypothetical protein
MALKLEHTRMDDIPWNMPTDAYGAFEPEGFCIWINEERQGDLARKNTGVLSHEFTHYVHSLSTFHAVDDLLTLLGGVHAGMQQLEDLLIPISLPLTSWSSEASCPPSVQTYVDYVAHREQAIQKSLGLDLDLTPPPTSTYRSSL